MKYVKFLVAFYLFFYVSSMVAVEIILNIDAERIGLDKKAALLEFKNAIRSMKTQDKYVIIEVINFLYAKRVAAVHPIGLRGTVFLLCKAERLLRYYEELFTNTEVYNKLIADIKQKKEELDHYQE